MKYIHKALQKCPVCDKIVPKAKICIYCGAWLTKHITGTRSKNMKIKKKLDKKHQEREEGTVTSPPLIILSPQNMILTDVREWLKLEAT